MIYTQGTLSTVSGSAIVRGTGTKFKDNLNGIAPGQVILIQSGSSNLLHLIQAVNSDTELVLADKAKTTLNNVTYQIQTTVPNSISDGVRHMCAINSSNIQFLQNMDKWMTQNGTVEVTLPNGQTVSLQSIKAMNEVIAGKLDKSQNGADIPNKTEFVRNIGLNNALKTGEYGIGSTTGRFITDNDYNNAVDSGVYSGPGSVTVRNSVGSIQYGPLLVLSRHVHHVYQQAHFQKQFYYRYRETGIWSDWHAVWTEGNTHVDNGGIIRKASPIIKIFPLGKFTTNDESEGATVSKLGLGHYQITGVLGYNADGAWGVHGGISSPKNNNGLELIYIDDKVNKDGSITIETFHRQHSHLPARFQNKRIKALVNGEKVYYQDGEPCDIPEGCRLDVRVQMPENSVWNVRQKEAEVATDSDQAELVE
ncbi:pyocin knob domain-containing protein [Xenorhabdus sp. KJ12.1]|uniref:pyocin knob domain-containing protein n=1 Tax=Xenorhabdus sp. KJ12.1 TaxID=1851571 RepID=UPI000C05D363|nr:pyocin knob domain-containing protein [Xenorhabdus sp. KJ12.1]PHM71422.1 NgrE [Xenorhabdus sp. KJ12.1]